MMRLPIAVLLLAAFAGAAAAAKLAPQERSVISGADFQVVAAAVEGSAAIRRDPVEGYAIHIYEDDSRYIVAFLDPDRPHGAGSTSEKMFEFEVELNKPDLSLIRWHGIR